MREKIFLAGATGAIGSVLTPLLIDAGYAVYGTTRQTAKSGWMEALGAIPVVLDVFDAAALRAAMTRIAPACVIHQLTDLPRGLDPAKMAEAVARNARIRDEGTRNLAAAAVAAGCKRMIAQSIAWAYAPGPQPLTETAPLDLAAQGDRRISVGGVAALETLTLDTPGLTGTVLRYGQLYGAGTGRAEPAGASPLHVEAAAHAALLALRHASGGIFNIVEDNPVVSNEKARCELQWRPDVRLSNYAA